MEPMSKMDLKYQSLDLEGEAAAMKESEEISEQDWNNEEDGHEGDLAITSQDCCYCLARINAYTTYVRRQQIRH